MDPSGTDNERSSTAHVPLKCLVTLVSAMASRMKFPVTSLQLPVTSLQLGSVSSFQRRCNSTRVLSATRLQQDMIGPRVWYWKLETGNWKLGTGNWQLATGNWQLATRNWQRRPIDNLVKSFTL